MRAVEEGLWKEPAPELRHAEALRAKGDVDEAMRVCVKYMNDNYDDVQALLMASHIFIDADRWGLAFPLLKLASKLKPESGLIWCNLGLCYSQNHDYYEAESCLIKAVKINPDDVRALNNLANLYYNMGQPLRAINCADKVIKLEPEMHDGEYNKALAQLLLGDWNGWKGFDAGLGRVDGRKERLYGRLPRWTGVEGCKLICFGEQGIGDEISFASCIPDLMKKNEVTIECDKRLAGLFKRSFPDCPVFGTRFNNQITWPLKQEYEASVAMGSLPGFYRLKDEDFPGTPYLKADPERRIAFRALLDSLGDKPKVGIAWSGGTKKTGAKHRSILLGDMLPILRQDATFISLQHKDASEIEALEETHGIKVHHWPHIVQTVDYDDTAALVAELDLVITVQQSVVHLAGGLGVPCWVMLPKAPLWRYRMSGDKFLWANSVKLYRQKSDWLFTINDVAKDLRTYANSHKCSA